MYSTAMALGMGLEHEMALRASGAAFFPSLSSLGFDTYVVFSCRRYSSIIEKKLNPHDSAMLFAYVS